MIFLTFNSSRVLVSNLTKMKNLYRTASIILLIFAVSACGPGNGVFFENLEDGDTVDPSFIVEMGVNGMEIEPAGPVNEGKGHHHIIVDGDFIPEGTPVPVSPKHIHFGQGQTETLLRLEPGEHTITLQFADGIHTSYGKKWSKTITVNVE